MTKTKDRVPLFTLSLVGAASLAEQLLEMTEEEIP